MAGRGRSGALAAISLVAILINVASSLPARARDATPSAATSTVDWPSARFDNQLTGNNPLESTISASNVGQLTIAWSSTVAFNPKATPVLAGGLIYLACSGAGNLPSECAVDASTGTLRWTAPIGTGEMPSTAAVDSAAGVVYVGAQNPATMYALDAASGAIRWHSATTAQHFEGEPTLLNGLVGAVADDGTLYAFSTGTGAIAWTFAAGGGNGITMAPSVDSYPAATIVNVVGQTATGGVLYNLKADGSANCGPVSFGQQVVGSPATDGTHIYVGIQLRGGNGAGSNFFSYPAGVCNPPSSSPAGGPVPSVQIPAVPSSSAAIAGNWVYQGFADGNLYVFDNGLNQLTERWTGNTLRQAAYGSWSILAPAVANGVVYAGSADGNVYAWNAAGCGGSSCAPLWNAKLGDTLYGGPIVANGMVFANFASGAKGTLYAFSLNGTIPIPRPAPPAPVSTVGQAVSYQMDPGHDGTQPGDTLTPTLKRAWEVDFPIGQFDLGTVSYPLIVNGRVYVTVWAQGQGVALHAYDLASGAALWTTMLDPPDAQYRESATFDNGRIFVSGGTGVLRSIDAITGAYDWSVFTPDVGYSPPVALDGRVLVGRQYDVAAYSESDGSLLWTRPYPTDLLSLSSTGAYATFFNQGAIDFNPADGTTLWSHNCVNCGVGSPTGNVLSAGRLYAPDNPAHYPNPIYDAQSGAVLGNWAGDHPPALDQTRAFDLINGTLEGRDLASQTVLWSFAGDARLGVNPIVVNGYVYELSKSGRLYALDETTGRVVWTDNTGGNTESTCCDTAMVVGLGVGDGALVVPAQNKLIAYTSTGNGPAPPAPPAGVPPGSGPPAVSFQVDPQHSGGQPADTLTPPPAKRWSVDLKGSVSYPLIAQGMVYVTVGSLTGLGSQLYALDQQTGHVAWGPVAMEGGNPDGAYARNRSDLAYDNGKIFAVNYQGLVQAFDASSGQLLWSRVPYGVVVTPTRQMVVAPPVAFGGVVYVTQSENTLLTPTTGEYAMDEATGRVLWFNFQRTAQATQAVSASGLFHSSRAGVTFDDNPMTGAQQWQFVNSCGQGYAPTPALFGGRLYIRDAEDSTATSCGTTGDVLDATSGTKLGQFLSDGPPAFSGNAGFFTSGTTLEARDLTTDALLWSFTGDGQLQSAPLLDNGMVYVGSQSGSVFGIDAATGKQVWTGTVPAAISAPAEFDEAQPLTGLNAGQGVLVVPAGTTLSLFGPPLSPAPSPTPTPTPSPSPTPTATATPTPTPTPTSTATPTPTPTTTATPTPTPTPTSMTTAGAYHPLSPARILDTRNGTGGRLSPLGSGENWALAVTGAGGVPSDAVAAVLNVTATNTTAPSFLTLYPDGVTRPMASNLNWRAGQTIPNLVEVKLGTGGRIDLFNAQGRVDVIVDVEGWVGGAQPITNTYGLFEPLVPSRLLDTRDGTGGATTVGPGSTISLQVDGRGGVPAGGVAAVVLNVTAVNSTMPSFVTAWPDGESRPNASNLNFVGGQTIPNRVLVKVGTDGKIDLYNQQGSVDLVADVNGWFSDGTSSRINGSTFTGVTPSRIVDSRDGTGGWTSPLGATSQRSVMVAGHGGVPAINAAHPPTAVVLNVTVTNTTAPSFLTVWPDGAPLPLSSDLNWIAGTTIPNLVVVRLGANGAIDLYNQAGSTDVIVDVVGWYG